MDITVNAQNSSKVLLDGQAKDIVVNAQNSSEVDAVNMFVNDAELSVIPPWSSSTLPRTCQWTSKEVPRCISRKIQS